MWLGEFIVDGHYKTTNFAVYKRDKKKGGDVGDKAHM